MKLMPSFRGLMFAYVHAFLEQVLVSVACNGRHSLKERLARWLLMMRDGPLLRRGSRPWRRPDFERGRQQVTILDWQGLIEASCECYQLVRERVAFHLPRTYP